MRLLLDANLSPSLIQLLTQSGHDAVHVVDIEMLAAPDSEILQIAEDDERVLVTADTDFPMMLALRQASSPSVVLLRGVSEVTPDVHADLLVANLPSVQPSKPAPSSLSHPRVCGSETCLSNDGVVSADSAQSPHEDEHVRQRRKPVRGETVVPQGFSPPLRPERNPLIIPERDQVGGCASVDDFYQAAPRPDRAIASQI